MIPPEVVQAMCMLAAWSLLYRENVTYRIAESMTIGLFLGVTLNYAVDILGKKVYTPLFIEGLWFSGIPVVTILGLLMYTRFFKPVWWVSRWPIAILAAVGSAVAVRGAIGPQIIKQLPTLPLIGPDLLTTINRFLLPLATVTALCQFIFTKKQKGVFGGLTFVGRMFLMVAFGFMLGTFLMSNIAFAIGNMAVLATLPGAYITAIAILILIGWILLEKAKAKKSAIKAK